MSGILEKGKKYVMNTYARFPMVFARGEGMYLYDENGKKYLDFVAGIAVNSLGYGDRELTSAIAKQAQSLIHCSNLYYTEPQVLLAEKLVKNSSFENVFFCNSGAEAIEAALKLIRKYGNKDGKGKTEIITMINSFHGRTYGALSATGQEKYQKSFVPLLPEIKHVPFNDIQALKAAITESTGGIVVEPVQGEGGIRPADALYLKQVRELCDEKDILLVFDEVQCGIGRTGYLFAHEPYGVVPDLAAIAKGIAGGVPMGALLANKKTAGVFNPGDHASTFGGNPLAAAAANVVLDRLLNGGLLENVKKQGAYLTSALNGLKAKHGMIKEVRGIGLMQGIELDCPVSGIIEQCIEKGLLLVSAGQNVIRFVPPLIVQPEHIDAAIGILEEAMDASV